ncbi:hypothetical protein YC2023_104569 [Brassica napus]
MGPSKLTNIDKVRIRYGKLRVNVWSINGTRYSPNPPTNTARRTATNKLLTGKRHQTRMRKIVEACNVLQIPPRNILIFENRYYLSWQYFSKLPPLNYKMPESFSFFFIPKLGLIYTHQRRETTMALKNLLSLVVLLGVVGVSVASPYENPFRKSQSNPQSNPGTMGNLDLDYYRYKCPQMEDIVRRVTIQYVSPKPTLAAALLRMHFHDCFVRGCDGSILIKSPNNDAERDAPPNLTLKGYEVVDALSRSRVLVLFLVLMFLPWLLETLF